MGAFRSALIFVVFATLGVPGSAALADDMLKVAVAQAHAFENQPAQARDIFKKHGIALTLVPAHGGADALQEVMSGAADIAVGVDTVVALRTLAHGAPLRALMPVFTGVSDLYWFVRQGSAISDLASAGDASIAYSTAGTVTHAIVTDHARDLRIAGKPVATGSAAATLVDVISGKIAIGYGRAPFGLKEAPDKIRIVAKGADMPLFRACTLRVAVVTADTSQRKRDALIRFVRAWREASDAMFNNETVRKTYAQAINVPADVLENAVRDYFPKAALQTETLSGLDEIVSDAVRRKLIEVAPAQDALSSFSAIPPLP